ncbi:hypothetical protein BKA70DRAFT_790574 [Coprinopsis sp. MPI-PUGE-AT-0042]|nr:hypothetical protein BKA70DRAFT_790574 [Coprinopsis sp. MPI-PUGE-AT-0042]
MPQLPPSSSNYAIVRSHLGRILAAQSTKRKRSFGRQVLHYDSRAKSLAIWFWPVYDKTDKIVQDDSRLENARVQPSDLDEYCRHHYLKAPSCLCALMDGVTYTESNIHLAGPESVKTGMYVAECAQNRCGYYVHLEDFYPLEGLRIRKYPRRDRPLKRCETYGLLPERLDLPEVTIGIDGISEAEFQHVLVQCILCKRFMPTLALPGHLITFQHEDQGPREVIDLTGDD